MKIRPDDSFGHIRSYKDIVMLSLLAFLGR